MNIDKKKLKNRIFIVLRIVVSIGILFFLFKTQFSNFSEIIEYLSKTSVNFWLIGLSFIMYWLGIYFLVLRWQILLKTQNIKAPMSFLFGSYLVGYFFNNFLPTSIGGDVYRIYDTSKLKNSSGMKAASIVLMERTTGVMSSIIYLVFALSVGFLRTSHVEFKMGKWTISNNILIILILAFFIFAVLIILIMLFPDYFRLNKFFRKLKFLHKWEDKLRQMYNTFKDFRKFKVILLITIILSMILQFTFTLNYSFCSQGFGINELSLISYIFIIQISSILTMIPISIGGIGVREGAFVVLVGALGGPRNIATIVSIAVLIMILVPGVVGGIIYALRPYMDRKRKLADAAQAADTEANQ
ncbi:MAG: lysylphosphatidylglycerol synthase transmembrane domain-containing protein [Actinomycetota bacterium]|nr:lysylphosphatidylglycerol synthase transmembrane domain-containing protein [Actinomycetota bacterium]